MGIGKIGDVDVIADGGAVARVEIEAVYREGPVLPERRLDGQRDDMCFGLMVLADLAVGVASGRVEVAQDDGVKAVRPSEILDHPFDGEFRPAIRIDWRLWVALVDRQPDRNAVGGA